LKKRINEIDIYTSLFYNFLYINFMEFTESIDGSSNNDNKHVVELVKKIFEIYFRAFKITSFG